jgi:hypothetical protein
VQGCCCAAVVVLPAAATCTHLLAQPPLSTACVCSKSSAQLVLHELSSSLLQHGSALLQCRAPATKAHIRMALFT